MAVAEGAAAPMSSMLKLLDPPLVTKTLATDDRAQFKAATEWRIRGFASHHHIHVTAMATTSKATSQLSLTFSTARWGCMQKLRWNSTGSRYRHTLRSTLSSSNKQRIAYSLGRCIETCSFGCSTKTGVRLVGGTHLMCWIRLRRDWSQVRGVRRRGWTGSMTEMLRSAKMLTGVWTLVSRTWRSCMQPFFHRLGISHSRRCLWTSGTHRS